MGIIDDYAEIRCEADYLRLKKELPINIELREEQRKKMLGASNSSIKT